MGRGPERVGGVLSVTRAFGDFGMKDPAEWVSPEPYVRKIEVNSAVSHVIIASDGLWDVLSPE